MKTAEEMTAYGRHGKPKAGFHRVHRLWKSLRDSHIPSAATQGRGKVESQNQASHFPTARRFPYMESKTKTGGLKRGAALPTSGSFFD
jgi:hypothetical protein